MIYEFSRMLLISEIYSKVRAMNLDLDLTSFNGGGGMPMECNMRSMAEKRSKTYEDPAIMVSSFF